ncbi:hypothetical protein FH972_017848 [Carpinus fangiana]|uniref:Glutamate receptor n=1 Tax=Carpinus fangiana TaxID=176857 RepID=A0A5N6RKD6_9ROSI|nr:hypothetical protein FH972_017848 [Carpinus fangiana]
MFLGNAQNTTVPVDVGVVLDMDTWNGKMGWSCINMALSDFYASHPYYKTRLRLNIRDSKRDVVGAAASALYLIKNVEVQAIIGPQNSMQANFVIDLGKKAQVPIISFSATSPSLTSLRSPYFFQIAQNDSSQVKAISAIIQAFGWREAVPIYVDNTYGKGIVPYLIDALQEINARVPYRSVIPPSATDDQIGQELYKLMTMQTRVFIVHMSHNLSSRLFIKATEIGMMREGYVWIVTNGIANSFSLSEPLVRESMQGVLESGLIRKLNLANTSTLSTSKDNLGPIIWPGDSSFAPKSWEIPTNGKKLRIGVPVKDGFTKFVKVTRDPSTNTTEVTGYCIAVFNAVMEKMPYTVSYEFIPFAKPDGGSAGNYNDLVYQVFLGNFDAVVGDTTIIANRSNFVDFALPYTESGVSMVVPIQDNRPKNAWVFLKPLTWDLWMTSGCFFVSIGFVVWVLEHRINDDFRGPRLHQIGTCLWYAFSTMVFSHREPVLSNCARFVVIVWVFVVLILTQSYTASLTSLLTIQQLQPTITDFNQLIKNREYVGYQEGSFVFEILKEMNFDTSKLRQYNSTDQCDELLSNGSANGGIAAAFDEIPYMNLFLGEYCSKYTMVASVYKTDGFGFGFPRGSPLVADVSRAILNVTEGEKMKEIEKAWLGKETNCPDFNTQVSSNSLSLASFRGSLGRRIRHTLRIFDRKDLSSRTFRRRALGDRNGIDSVHVIGASEPSPDANYWSPTPLSHSTCVIGDPETPSSEYADLISPTDQVSEPAGDIEQIVHPNQEGP